jgi:hypothetical protein
MELLLHSFGAFSLGGLIFNQLRRYAYLNQKNYGLKHIPIGTEIIHIKCRNYIYPKFYITMYPLPFTWCPYDIGASKKTSYVKFKHNDQIIEYNANNIIFKKLKFDDYMNVYNHICINGELKLNEFCNTNSIFQNDLLIDFPAVSYKRVTNNDQYLHIKNSVTSTTISIYENKEKFDEIFWFIYIRTFINMIILYFVLCVMYYGIYKKKK